MEQENEKKPLDLTEIRDQIDEVDHVIVNGFQKRMELVHSVAEYKIANKIPVLDPKRESDKIAELSGLAHSRFNQRGIRDIFMQMMSISRKMQYRMLSDAGVFQKYHFERVEEIRRKDVRVVFQGVPGRKDHVALICRNIQMVKRPDNFVCFYVIPILILRAHQPCRLQFDRNTGINGAFGKKHNRIERNGFLMKRVNGQQQSIDSAVGQTQRDSFDLVFIL